MHCLVESCSGSCASNAGTSEEPEDGSNRYRIFPVLISPTNGTQPPRCSEAGKATTHGLYNAEKKKEQIKNTACMSRRQPRSKPNTLLAMFCINPCHNRVGWPTGVRTHGYVSPPRPIDNRRPCLITVAHYTKREKGRDTSKTAHSFHTRSS